jgi:hypothetical protein
MRSKCFAEFMSLAGAIFATAIACGFASASAWSETWKCKFSGDEDITFVAEYENGTSTNGISTTDVSVHEGPGAISFFEPLPTGSANLTTIVLKTGEASRSRNMLTSLESGSFLAIQVVGKCQRLSVP